MGNGLGMVQVCTCDLVCMLLGDIAEIHLRFQKILRIVVGGREGELGQIRGLQRRFKRRVGELLVGEWVGDGGGRWGWVGTGDILRYG